MDKDIIAIKKGDALIYADQPSVRRGRLVRQVNAALINALELFARAQRIV